MAVITLDVGDKAMFKTQCPRCDTDGDLVVINVVLVATDDPINVNAPLSTDGFDFTEALIGTVWEFLNDRSTEDELVECFSCHRRFELADLLVQEESPPQVHQTEEVGLRPQDWQIVVDMQDACSVNIGREFPQLLDRIWAEAHRSGRGTDWVNHHPLVYLMVDKLCDLTGRYEVGTPRYGAAYHLARTKAGLETADAEQVAEAERRWAAKE